MAAHWEEGQGVRGAYGTLVHHGGVALHYVWRKTSGRCPFGCPFSPKRRMNLRCNSTGRTADASHTASTSYLSASESHRHCQLVVSSVCVSV